MHLIRLAERLRDVFLSDINVFGFLHVVLCDTESAGYVLHVRDKVSYQSLHPF